MAHLAIELRRIENASISRALGLAGDEEPPQWIGALDEASLASEAALCSLQFAEFRKAELCAREVIRQRQGDPIRWHVRRSRLSCGGTA